MIMEYIVKLVIFALVSVNLVVSVPFNVKLTNVDSSSAEFELLDDNKTTMNYEIVYTARSNGTTTIGGYSGDSDGKSVTIVLSNKISLETNQMTLLNKQEELLGEDDSAAESLLSSSKPRDNGELYTSDDKMKFLGRTYEEIHRFLVPDLEPNREYELTFSIRAKEAYLSSLLTGVYRQEKPEDTVEKQFKFNFKTTFDYDSAAALACKNSQPQTSQPKQPGDTLSDAYSSCYVSGSNCTKCGQTCYEVKQTRNELNQKPQSTSGGQKPILCEACPCDTSRSTGECFVEQTSSDNGYQQIKCKQCKEPYVGPACNDCQNEGVDYYKNEHGECVKCFCNNNAALDFNPSSKRRKCQSITGICIDCLYNTTGRHCEKCILGFKGDAISRTCVEEKLPSQTIRDPSSTNSNQRSPKYIDPNERYSYKTLALFSLYIFCVLSLVLLIFLCIKSRYYGRDHMLKAAANNSPNADSSSSADLAARIQSILATFNQSGRQFRSRVTFYFGSICPTTMRFVRVASNQPHAYSGDPNAIGTNDDDRLNLAEYQMFDDSLLNVNSGSGGAEDGAFTYRATFNDVDDVQNDSRNPYRSLTIKT